MEFEQLKLIVDSVWEKAKDFLVAEDHITPAVMVFHKGGAPELINFSKFERHYGKDRFINILHKYFADKDPDAVIHITEANALAFKAHKDVTQDEAEEMFEDLKEKYGQVENIPHNAELLMARGFLRGGQTYERMALINRSVSPIGFLENPFQAHDANAPTFTGRVNWLDNKEEQFKVKCPKCVSTATQTGDNVFLFQCESCGTRFVLLDEGGQDEEVI